MTIKQPNIFYSYSYSISTLFEIFCLLGLLRPNGKRAHLERILLKINLAELNYTRSLEKAQNSLQAKFNSSSSAIISNPPVFQEIRSTSLVKGVWFTWVIISSDDELSINLRYVGNGPPPPLSVAAFALAKNNEGSHYERGARIYRRSEVLLILLLLV
jgi:hypothetical protein